MKNTNIDDKKKITFI